MQHMTDNEQSLQQRQKDIREEYAPTASWEVLHLRAQFIMNIHDFFRKRGVLSVETPLLGNSSVPCPEIHSITCHMLADPKTYYLQTSPEFSMKRLLAAGSGPIYQICKAFRATERGRLHNPEFSMLEWYRPDWTEQQLMQEVDVFLQELLQCQPMESLSYRDCFMHYCQFDPHTATISELRNFAAVYCQFDPHTATISELRNFAAQANLSLSQDLCYEDDKDFWLQLLMNHCIEPHIAQSGPCAVYDYPATQAALARLGENALGQKVAKRFEVYFQGKELANGFYELGSAVEQRQRFLKENLDRRARSLPELPIDELFLQALAAGLPDCSGVAIGLDRVFMLAVGATTIEEVLAFPLEVA